MPVCNDAQRLKAWLTQWSHTDGRVVDDGATTRLELLIVDDGSTDDTHAMVASWRSRWPGLHYLRLSRRFGRKAALAAGLACAQGDAVILMPVGPLPVLPNWTSLIESWRQGADVVIAAPLSSRSSARAQSPGLAPLPRRSTPPATLKLLDRRAIDQLLNGLHSLRDLDEMSDWLGFETRWVDDLALLETRDGGCGQSSLRHPRPWTPWRAWPMPSLQTAGNLGLTVSLAALLYGLWLSIEHMEGRQLPGWATIVVGMMVLSGVQLLALGVITQYLGRIAHEVKLRPIYVVSEEAASEGHLAQPLAAGPCRDEPCDTYHDRPHSLVARR